MSDPDPLIMPLPSQGQPKDDVFNAMRAARDHDLRWKEGRAFCLVYHAGEEVSQVAKEAYQLFFSENALNPTAFPSLLKFETEVVAMTAALLDSASTGASVTGNMTTGGTESILMAVLAAREWARRERPSISAPEIVVPASAHPAFDKAAHYFGVRLVRVPLKTDFRADPAAIEAAITQNTILVAASAPSYPHGLIDPIREVAAVAQRHNILCHVDACVGGMLLPFIRRLGFSVPDFDFSVPGVTSMSVDLHKYGYAAKGASVILFRTPALRRNMFFATADWSGGVYASATMAGTRPGGAIAAAWAVMNFLGEAGYLELAKQVMQASRQIQQGVQDIPGLRILGTPEMSVLAIVSDELNIYEVGDELSQMGWQLDRQQFPPSLHLTLSPYHHQVADRFLGDLALAAQRASRPSLRRGVNQVLLSSANAAARWLPSRWATALTAQASRLLNRRGESGESGRSAPLYGLIGSLPNRGDIHELVLDLIDSLTRLPRKG